MAIFKSRRPSSVVGLAFEGRQLEGIVLQRSTGALRVEKTFRATLSLDPLTNDPELVGREILNHLVESGVRERRCAVCIPLQWVLTMQAKVPEMPEADVPGFLLLEAEHGFPYAPADLAISISRYGAPNGEQHASLVAVPKSHLTTLEKVLKAARLKPLTFSLGIAALQEVHDQLVTGLVTLALGETCVDLQVSARGGVVALRALEGVFEAEGAEKRIDADLIAREIRITLGQLPKELRETVNRITIFGPPQSTGPLVKDLTPIARDMGLQVVLGTPPHTDGLLAPTASQGGVAAAIGLAAKYLAGTPIEFEFLPPKQHAWSQLSARFSSAKVLYAGATVSAAALFVCGLFIWQQWTLSGLDSQWRAIKPKYTELDGLRQQIKKYGPWYDETVRSLRIIRGVTEAFSEDGAVFAKSLEIKDLSEINCSGQARDNQAWLKLLDQLKASDQIKQLKVIQTQGKAPMQFSLNFRWVEK